MIQTIKASKSEKILFIFLICLSIFAFTSFFLLKNKCLFVDKNNLNKLKKLFFKIYLLGMSSNFLLRNQSIHFLKSFYPIFLRSELLLLEDNSLLQFACEEAL